MEIIHILPDGEEKLHIPDSSCHCGATLIESEDGIIIYHKNLSCNDDINLINLN